MKVINEELLDIYRSKGRCENCGIPCQPEAHHLFTKGMGGAFRLDIHENIIALCMGCHRKFHNGTVSRETLVKVIAKRQKKTPAEIEQTVLRMRHLPKESIMQGHPAHPIASLFPRPTPAEFDALEKDILADGIKKPICLWNKQVMDGLTRQQIGLKHGLEVPTEDWSDLTEAEAIQKAYDDNFKSRPQRVLNATQRAAVASGLIPILQAAISRGRPSEKQTSQKTDTLEKSAKNPVKTEENNVGPIGPTLSGNGKSSRRQAARQAGASEKTLARFNAVSKKVDPAIVQAMKDGLVKVNDAEKVANETHDRQVSALALVREGKHKTLKQALAYLKKTEEVKNQFAEGEPEEVPELTIEQVMKEKNSEIESFCRNLMKLTEECPDDEWLRDLNRKNGAMQKFKDGCQTLRSAKCTHVCPACKGDGCHLCLKTGRVPSLTYQQLT